MLTVADSGPGLPADTVDSVFHRGFSTKVEGVEGRRGIGLALVAQTVERLGGELEVTGPPGARFVVRLPGRGVAGATQSHLDEPAGDGRGSGAQARTAR